MLSVRRAGTSCSARSESVEKSGMYVSAMASCSQLSPCSQGPICRVYGTWPCKTKTAAPYFTAHPRSGPDSPGWYIRSPLAVRAVHAGDAERALARSVPSASAHVVAAQAADPASRRPDVSAAILHAGSASGRSTSSALDGRPDAARQVRPHPRLRHQQRQRRLALVDPPVARPRERLVRIEQHDLQQLHRLAVRLAKLHVQRQERVVPRRKRSRQRVERARAAPARGNAPRSPRQAPAAPPRPARPRRPRRPLPPRPRPGAGAGTAGPPRSSRPWSAAPRTPPPAPPGRCTRPRRRCGAGAGPCGRPARATAGGTPCRAPPTAPLRPAGQARSPTAPPPRARGRGLGGEGLHSSAASRRSTIGRMPPCR